MLNTSTEHRPERFMQYPATLLVAALLAYAAYLGWQSWRIAESEEASQLATIAALSENSLDIYFNQLQIGIQNMGAELGVTHQKPDLDRAYSLISRFQGLHTELSNVMLIRSDGQILLTGATPDRSDLPTLADDPAFKKIRDELLKAPPFVISQPVMGHIDNSWVVSAGYAVTDDAGKLAYIISANLPVDMLQRYWIDSIMPRITALGLVRDDGYLVSCYPEPGAASLNKMYGKPLEGAMAEYLRANKHPAQGLIEIRNSEGKTTGLLAMRRLQHYPLTLFVEMPAKEIRAAWWNNMHAPYVLVALALAATFAFYSLTRRRAWTVEKRREELRHHYEHALRERSPNEIFMFDTGMLQLGFANDQALENLGYTLKQLQQKSMLELHPESSIQSFGAMLGQLRRGEQESITYQTTQMRANGSCYPVEVNLQLIKEEDGAEELLAIVHDITALKQAEENIRKFNAPLERRRSRNNQGSAE